MIREIRILIIENSEDDALLVLNQIKQGGYNFEYELVDTAKGMRVALKTKTWDIILSDYKMPHFSGLEALSIYKESGLDIPFIIVSGSIGEELAVEAMKAGAYDYVMKYNLKRLLPVVERELNDAKQRAETKLLEQKQKQTEKALQESEEEYRILFENVPIGIGVSDFEGKLIAFNDAMLVPGGYTRDDIEKIGNVEELYYNRADRETIISTMKEHGFVNRFPIKFKRKDGSSYDTLLSLSIIHFKNQPRIQALVEDVTERNRIEESLRQSEIKLQVIIESTADGILAIESKGKVIKANKRFAELWKIPQEILNSDNDDTLLNFVISQLINPSQFLDKVKQLYNSIEQDTDTILFKDGRIFERYSAPLISNEKIIGRVWSFRDITERKHAEKEIKLKNEQLQKLVAEKDLFFSIIAHDLKSPFNSILGISDLLIEFVKKKDFNNLEKYSKIIQQSSVHAMELLTNLIDWSRSQTGRLNFNPVYFEISGLINEIESLFTDIAAQKSISIIMDLSYTESAYADKEMISTVLRNLISNAIKFTEPNGKIVVSTIEKQNEIMVSVKDTGVGVSPEAIEKLFLIDEMYSTPGTQNEKGTGLGLSICKEFIEKHGGKIWVESGAGKGTTFHFTLPKKS